MKFCILRYASVYIYAASYLRLLSLSALSPNALLLSSSCMTHTHTHTYVLMCQHIHTHAPFIVIIFSDTQNCAYRAVTVVLKNSQCNIHENWCSLILLNPGVHKSQVTISCTVVPNNSVSTVVPNNSVFTVVPYNSASTGWNLVQPTHVTPTILRQSPHFCNIC